MYSKQSKHYQRISEIVKQVPRTYSKHANLNQIRTYLIHLNKRINKNKTDSFKPKPNKKIS